MFKQLENWGQDPEDSRFGDLSDSVVNNLKFMLEESFEWEVGGADRTQSLLTNARSAGRIIAEPVAVWGCCCSSTVQRVSLF